MLLICILFSTNLKFPGTDFDAVLCGLRIREEEERGFDLNIEPTTL